MQLSWIDPEVLRELAEKLQDPKPSVPPDPVEGFGFMDIGEISAVEYEMLEPPRYEHLTSSIEPAPAPPPSPVVSTPVAVASPDPVPVPVSIPSPVPDRVELVGPPPQPDAQVLRIREQLRSIRARALEAGLLPLEPPPAPVARTIVSPFSLAVAEPSVPVPEPHLSAFTVADDDSASYSSSSAEPQSLHCEPVPVVAATYSAGPQEQTLATFHPEEKTLGERLEHFARWAGARISTDELLLVDDHGDVLWGSASRSELALAALLALNAALRSSAGGISLPPAIIRNQVAPDRELLVLPCATVHGTVTLAMVNPRGLSDHGLEYLRQALVLAVEGSAGARY